MKSKGANITGSSPVAAIQLSFEQARDTEETGNFLQGHLGFQDNLSNTLQHVGSAGKTFIDGAAVGDLELSVQEPECVIKASIHFKNLHGIKSQELVLEACPEPCWSEVTEFINDQANKGTKNQNHSEKETACFELYVIVLLY